MVVLLTPVTKIMGFAMTDIRLEKECSKRELKEERERNEMVFDLLGTKLSLI